jgi:hypothetical protein
VEAILIRLKEREREREREKIYEYSITKCSINCCIIWEPGSREKVSNGGG